MFDSVSPYLFVSEISLFIRGTSERHERGPKWAVSAFGCAKNVEESSEGGCKEGKKASRATQWRTNAIYRPEARRRTADGHRKQKPEWSEEGREEHKRPRRRDAT